MDIPQFTTASSFSVGLQAAKDYAAAFQSQDVSTEETPAFNQALESAANVSDTVEIHLPMANVNPDPTASSLFQSHLGALALSQISAVAEEGITSSAVATQQKVTGIDAVAGSGAYANRQPAQPDVFQSGAPEMSVMATRFAAVTGADEAGGTYGSRTSPAVGLRMDLEG